MKERKRRFSRILGLLLALVMVMSTGLAAFAMDGNEVYLSPASGTSYTTMVSSGTTSVSLEVDFTAYSGGSYYTTGFDDTTQAASVSWTVSNNTDGLINGGVSVSSGTDNSLITSKGTVTLNTGASGIAIVHAAYNGLTLDLVIARDAASVASGVTAKTYIVDVSSSDADVIVDNQSVAVYAPSTEEGAGLLTGKSAAFQNVATAMGTLDVLFAAEKLDSLQLSADGSYVSEINELSYWGYAVYAPGGALLDLSQSISASIFVLPSNGYTVVWKCGAWSFASTLEAEVASW